MYTYDQRIKTVQTYIEAHFSENHVIDAFRVPTTQ